MLIRPRGCVKEMKHEPLRSSFGWMRYLLLRGALIYVDCVKEVTRRLLRSSMDECVINLLRGATNEAMNTPAHFISEVGWPRGVVFRRRPWTKRDLPVALR